MDDHPSLEMLTAFDRGQLQPAEFAAVESHVAGCADCCRLLEGIDEDALIHLLRSSTGFAPHPTAEDTQTLPPESNDTPRQDISMANTAIPTELSDHPRYRILGVLGTGGMGVVYKAEHRLMERLVALKVIHERLTERPEAVERFRQEVKAAARLSHPGIVVAFDADQAGAIHFLVMEFVEGVSLDRLVRGQGPLPVKRGCDIARQAALALQHAFERGMVHRDIKPANLLLTPRGQVKVLDFGLARFVRESGSQTATGTVVGTPDYIAPEQALDSRQADIRADIYSLGCTLYFLLAGRPPYPEGSALQKLLAHQQGRPRPLAELRSDVPAELLRVLDRMMAADPAQRYPTPAEVAVALAPFADGEPAPPPIAVNPAGDDRTSIDLPGPAKSAMAELPQHPRGKRTNAVTLLLTLFAVVMVLAALGMGMHVWRLRNREKKPTLFAPLEERPNLALAEGEVDHFGGLAGSFTRAVLSADGQRALVVGEDSNIRLWNVETRGPDAGWKRGEVAVLSGHTERPMGLAFARDGRHALSGSMDRTVRLWDLQQRRLLRTMEAHTSWVRGVDFVGHDLQAVSAGNDARVLLWDTGTGHLLHEFPRHDAVVFSISASSSGRFAVSASMDRTARVWDLVKRQLAHCLRGHADSVTSAVFSRDEGRVLTGSADRTVILWDLATEKPIHVLRGHSTGVVTVTISSDGRLGLSGSGDGIIYLWDLQTGKKLHRYATPSSATIRSLAFSHDLWITSVGADGVFRYWLLP